MIKSFFSRLSLGRIFLILWIPTILAILSFQAATHLLSMPTPIDPYKIKTAVYANLSFDQPRWLAVHVVAADCSCSGSLVDQLLSYPMDGEVDEVVLFAGPHPNIDKLRNYGYDVIQMTPQNMELEYGIVAAPLFVVFSPDKELKYLGGYYANNRDWTSLDRGILTKLQAKQNVEERRVFGCPVAEGLKEQLDPTGIKRLISRIKN